MLGRRCGFITYLQLLKMDIGSLDVKLILGIILNTGGGNYGFTCLVGIHGDLIEVYGDYNKNVIDLARCRM